MAVFSFVSAAGQCLTLAESIDVFPVGQEGFALLEIDTGKAYRYTSGVWVGTSAKNFAALDQAGNIPANVVALSHRDDIDIVRLVVGSLLRFAVDKLGYVPDSDRIVAEYERSVR